jgi:hypothetical protein
MINVDNIPSLLKSAECPPFGFIPGPCGQSKENGKDKNNGEHRMHV